MTEKEFVTLWLALTVEIKNQIDEILGENPLLPESEVGMPDISYKSS